MPQEVSIKSNFLTLSHECSAALFTHYFLLLKSLKTFLASYGSCVADRCAYSLSVLNKKMTLGSPTSSLITATKGVICDSLSVGWLVILQDYTKNTGLISMKLDWRMGNGSRKNLLCGADMEKGEDPGILIQNALAELVCAVLICKNRKFASLLYLW